MHVMLSNITRRSKGGSKNAGCGKKNEGGCSEIPLDDERIVNQLISDCVR